MTIKYVVLFFIVIGHSAVPYAYADSHDVAPYTREVSLGSSDAALADMLSVPDSLYLRNLTLTADITIEDRELQSLMNIREATFVSKEDICKGFQRVSKKRKFDKAVLELSVVDDGYDIKIHFKACWTLAKVAIEGAMIGKDRYRQYYQGELGEPFDDLKHKHGIERIIKMLKEEGYLAARVDDQLIYDKTTKSVSVSLTLAQEDQFVIDDLHIAISMHNASSGEVDSLEGLQSALQKMLRGELCNTHYRQIALDEAARRLKRLLVRKGYLDATIELEESINKNNGRVRLWWTVRVQHKKAFEFFGNHFFSHDRLLEQLMLFGKSLALLPPSLLAEEIALCYKKKGFWDIQISWREDKDCIFFCITEGKRAQISNITIEGARAFAVADLVNQHFDGLIRSPGFDIDVVKIALDRMMQAYIHQGFWDISVISYDYRLLDDGTYQLVVKIDEHEQRFLKKISLVGFESLEGKEPFAMPSHGAPIPFDLYLVQEQRLWLTRYLQEQGYVYTTPHLELVSAPDGIEIRWEMRGTKEPVRFGPTIILGGSNLPATLILRELEYHEGDIWSKKKLDRSLQRLKALGIFETVSIFPDQMFEPEPVKTLLLRCFLDDPFEFRTRVGAQVVGRNLTYRGGATYKVGASMMMKNPTNRADLFCVDMDFTRYRRDIAAYYQVPWVGSIPVKAELRVYSSTYDQPIVEGSDERLYRALHDGVLVEFTKDLSHAQLAMNMGFEWMALKGVSPERALALHFEPRLIDTFIPYFFFEPTAFIDYLDDKVLPTKGSLTLVTLKGMIPFDISRAFFLKMLIEQSLFVPLTSAVVLGMRVRLGYIVHESFRLIMPPERFYLGGFHSLRGYDPDLAPPLNCFTDCKGIERLIPIGGKSMLNGTVELRFPLLAPIWGVVFTDLGFLAQDSLSAVNACNMLGASGFGLRCNTPFGPISFDIGWKWHKQSPLERSFAWFLTFGQPF